MLSNPEQEETFANDLVRICRNARRYFALEQGSKDSQFVCAVAPTSTSYVMFSESPQELCLEATADNYDPYEHFRNQAEDQQAKTVAVNMDLGVVDEEFIYDPVVPDVVKDRNQIDTEPINNDPILVPVVVMPKLSAKVASGGRGGRRKVLSGARIIKPGVLAAGSMRSPKTQIPRKPRSRKPKLDRPESAKVETAKVESATTYAFVTHIGSSGERISQGVDGDEPTVKQDRKVSDEPVDMKIELSVDLNESEVANMIPHDRLGRTLSSLHADELTTKLAPMPLSEKSVTKSDTTQPKESNVSARETLNNKTYAKLPRFVKENSTAKLSDEVPPASFVAPSISTGNATKSPAKRRLVAASKAIKRASIQKRTSATLVSGIISSPLRKRKASDGGNIANPYRKCYITSSKRRRVDRFEDSSIPLISRLSGSSAAAYKEPVSIFPSNVQRVAQSRDSAQPLNATAYEVRQSVGETVSNATTKRDDQSPVSTLLRSEKRGEVSPIGPTERFASDTRPRSELVTQPEIQSFNQTSTNEDRSLKTDTRNTAVRTSSIGVSSRPLITAGSRDSNEKHNDITLIVTSRATRKPSSRTDRTRKRSRNNTGNTSRDNTASTSRNSTGNTSRDNMTSTSRNNTGNTSRDNTTSTSRNNTGNTSLDNMTSTSRNNTGNTSRDNSTSTSRNNNDNTSRDNSTSTRRNNTGNTSRDNTTSTSRNNTGNTSRDNMTSTSRNNTGNTSRDNWTSTRRNKNGNTSRNNNGNTSQNNTGNISRDNMTSTSRNNTGNTSRDNMASTRRNNIGNTSQDNSTSTRRNNNGNTSRDNMASTSRNNIGNTSRDNMTSTSRNNTGNTSRDNMTSTSRNNIGNTSRDNTTSTSRNNMTNTSRNKMAGTRRNNIGNAISLSTDSTEGLINQVADSPFGRVTSTKKNHEFACHDISLYQPSTSFLSDLRRRHIVNKFCRSTGLQIADIQIDVKPVRMENIGSIVSQYISRNGSRGSDAINISSWRNDTICSNIKNERVGRGELKSDRTKSSNRPRDPIDGNKPMGSKKQNDGMSTPSSNSPIDECNDRIKSGGRRTSRVELRHSDHRRRSVVVKQCATKKPRKEYDM